jgi:hypothetical protein
MTEPFVSRPDVEPLLSPRELAELPTSYGRAGWVMDLGGECGPEFPNAGREFVDGDALCPGVDCVDEQHLVGAAQWDGARCADGVERVPDLVGAVEMADLMEELVAAGPWQFDRAAIRGDGHPVEAFGHALESRTS